MAPKKIKIAIIATHPIQYNGALYRGMSACSEVDLKVLFGTTQGVDGKTIDREFGSVTNWDRNILDGYRYEFLNTTFFFNNIYSPFLASTNIHLVLKNFDPDVVIITGWAKLIYLQALLFSLVKRVPVVLRCESNDYGERGSLRSRIRDAYLRNFFRFVTGFNSIGSRNDRLYERFGIPSDRRSRCPYAVDNAYFKQDHTLVSQSRCAVINRHGIPIDHLIVLWVGKFIKRKDPLQAILAIENSNKRKIGISLIMVGSGELEPELRRHCEFGGLHYIHFTGYLGQSEVCEYYSAADIILMTSNYETWGLSVNEGMAAGLCPIVSSNCGCVDDLIIDGITGYVYEKHRTDELCNILIQLENDRKKLQQVRASAASFIESVNQVAVGSRLVEFSKKLIGQEN